MSFEDLEYSRESGQPVNLYRFVKGAEGSPEICYTDAESPILFKIPTTQVVQTFQPVAIQRDSVRADGTLDKSRMPLKVGRDTEISELFRIYPPAYIVNVFIYEGHFGDPEFVLVWTGKVMQRTVTGMEATLSCEPIASSFKRPGLRRNWQRGCMLALYGQGPNQCNAQRTGKAVSVSAVVSNTRVRLQYTGSMPAPDVNMAMGTLAWTKPDGDPEIRNVLSFKRESASTILVQVSGTTQFMPAGTTLNFYPGCRHTTEDCSSVFNNILNYGGDPYIPTNNPVMNFSTYM